MFDHPCHWIGEAEHYAGLDKFDKKIKCGTNPSDASSTTYKICMTYFKEGTPEKWLMYKNQLNMCLNDKAQRLGQINFHWLGSC